MEFLVVIHLLMIVFMLQSFLSQCQVWASFLSQCQVWASFLSQCHLRNSSQQCIHVVVNPACVYMCNCVFPASATPTCVIYV